MSDTRAQDHIEIVELLYRYGERIDAGDFDGIGEMFAHGSIGGPGMNPVEGSASVAEMYRSTTRRYPDGTPRTRHLVTNPIVEFDPDDPDVATARATFCVVQATDVLALQPIIVGRYHDRFRRIDGRWWFSNREMRPELIGDLSQHLLFELTPDHR